MSRVSRERMSWSLRDPLFGLLHQTYKCIVQPPEARRVSYWTSCGQRFTVDDVNAKTMVKTEPTCLSCVVARPLPDVLDDEE